MCWRDAPILVLAFLRGEETNKLGSVVCGKSSKADRHCTYGWSKHWKERQELPTSGVEKKMLFQTCRW